MSTVCVCVCVCVFGRGEAELTISNQIMVEQPMSETDFEACFVRAYGDANSINRSQWRKGNVHKTPYLP